MSVSCGFEPGVALGLNLVKYNLPGGPISGVHYNHRLDPVPGQPPSDPGIAVALLPGQLHRPAPRPPASARQPNGVHDRLELGALLPLVRREHRRQRGPVAVAGQADLRAEPAPRAAQGVVLRLAAYFSWAMLMASAAARLARMTVPSMQNSSASIRPPALSLAWRQSRIRSIRPDLREALKRW